MRMPASVAYSEPPATAPCMPRDGKRTSRSCRCGCCPTATAASIATVTASLSFIWKPLYGIGARLGAEQGRKTLQAPGPGDRGQTGLLKRISGKRRRKFMAVSSVPGGGDQHVSLFLPVSYTHLTLPTKRIV